MPLIETTHLQKLYQDGAVTTTALADVSFSVAAGEFVAIMGPSGSGKSTLLHILGFLDRPSAGRYAFSGKAIDEYTEDELARVRNEKMGFVFQAFNLLPRTTVLENVTLPLAYSHTPKKEHRTRAEKAIESVGLGHRLDHTPAELSGGERQRVSIARALVNTPDVLFADEPTGNLDSVSGMNIMEMLAGFNRDAHQTIILITHDDDAASFAHRTIRLRDGAVESDEKKK